MSFSGRGADRQAPGRDVADCLRRDVGADVVGAEQPGQVDVFHACGRPEIDAKPRLVGRGERFARGTADRAGEPSDPQRLAQADGFSVARLAGDEHRIGFRVLDREVAHGPRVETGHQVDGMLRLGGVDGGGHFVEVFLQAGLGIPVHIGALELEFDIGPVVPAEEVEHFVQEGNPVPVLRPERADFFGRHLFRGAGVAADPVEVVVVENHQGAVLAHSHVGLESGTAAVERVGEGLEGILVDFRAAAPVGEQAGSFSGGRFILGAQRLPRGAEDGGNDRHGAKNRLFHHLQY